MVKQQQMENDENNASPKLTEQIEFVSPDDSNDDFG